MVWIGIDPGGSGGIAWVTNNGIVGATRMPETEADILAVLWDCVGRSCGYTPRAVIEHVWSTPGQGGAFKFGKSVGGLLMALTAAEIAFDQVLPRAWQKTLGVVYAKGLTDTEKKNITKRRAQQLFPTLTITHAIADALLMAEYCRRLHRGSYGKEQEQGAREVESREAAKVEPCRWTDARREERPLGTQARERADLPGDPRPEGRRADAAREDLRRRDVRLRRSAAGRHG